LPIKEKSESQLQKSALDIRLIYLEMTEIFVSLGIHR